jgi:signal transduction histidine kinase/ligand-binding sensor domain-containing protein
MLRILRAFCLLMLAAGCHCAGAAALRPLLTDYTHSAWTERDGAPTGVTKFAQGPDGWLWIATPTGLYRFDGVRFERTDTVHGHRLASSNIMALSTAPDGALWVGYRVGGVSVFRADGARTYAEDGGLRPVGVLHIEAAPDGAIWAAMRDGVAVLAPGAARFRYLGPGSGLPPLGVFQILFARDGSTWVGTNSGAYFRKRGETRFTRAWPHVTLVWLCEAPDGTIWGNDFKQGYYRVRTIEPAAGTPAGPELEGYGMRFDRHGVMWMMHPDGLERRLAADAPEQRLSKENGISGPLPGALFEDREGNLWLGTQRGMDRLRPNRLRTLSVTPQLESPALVQGPAGEMWVGDYAGDLWRFDREGRVGREVEGKITASYTAPDGVLWLGAMEGVRRRARDGVLTMFRFPDELTGLRVHAMQQDRDGVLWVSFSAGKGVYRLAQGRWSKAREVPDLLATSMAPDADGNVWIGHARSQVSIVNVGVGAVRQLGAAQGLQLGTILTLHADGNSMWAGGENGVALFRAGRFAALRGARGEQFRGVSGIVRTPGGELWLHGADGLYRIAGADLDRWLNDTRGALAFERFDAQDGMQGHAPQLRPVPSLKRARDGVLWYATGIAVGSIDPARILRNRLAPPLHVGPLIADGVRYPLADGRVPPLAPGTRTLQIDFTALSLSIPERVRLRYRLLGFDHGWQDALGRRQAYYTNLAPGKYRFEVIGSNEDNLWNTSGAALDLSIAPSFVQSGWFTLLAVALGALLLYGAYALRIGYLTRRMQERLQERLAERTRVARALHDTLLQSVQALLMSFDAHSRKLEQGTPERMRLEQTLNLAEQLLVEGRDQIMGLRTPASQQVLELALGQFGQSLAGYGPHSFGIKVEGRSRALRPDVHAELYAIAREALFNASRYAKASRIELELAYGANAFALRIRDNGRGLDDLVAAAGQRAGHWGLVGMRERAAGIGALLEIDSQAGAGTDITVTLPGQMAY